MIGGSAHDPKELIESALERAEVRKVSEMPFPDQRRVITLSFYERRDRRMFAWDTDRLYTLAEFFLFGDRFFETDRKSGGIASGDPTDTRRSTHGRRGVRVRESNSLRRKFIEIRSLVIRPAVATEIRPAHVIGEYEENVWTTLRIGG